MILVVAEKPSVARNVATAVGAKSRQDGYIEGAGYLVTWCLGHLVELADPKVYDERYEKWTLEDLPILPERWEYEVKGDKGARGQFSRVKKLMNRADVEKIVCATDADREGELIFRLVYDKAGCSKPVARLWTSSQEPDAIQAALKSVKPASSYDGLAAAAYGRQRADWLVGINLTRLYTKLYDSQLTCGRVQTPVVAELVAREAAIKHFKPVPYWVDVADLGGFTARCQFDSAEEANTVAAAAQGAEARIAKVETKPKKTAPPRLYSLTTLQKDAARLLGLSAADTLAAAQALYEKRLATYPRTDSQYITSDLAPDVAAILDAVCDARIVTPSSRGSLRDAGVLVNDSKVEGHPAITPTASVTASAVEELGKSERDVLALVAWRLVCALGEPCETESTTVVASLADREFTARGRRTVRAGWRADETACKAALKGARDDGQDDGEDDQALPALREGEVRTCSACTVEQKETKPPSHHTEESILDFMEHAGRAVDDAELAGVLKGRGIGTPATRAAVIENVVSHGYAKRSGKKLLPTAQAVAFTAAVTPELKEPATTAAWESQLAEVEDGRTSLDEFMAGIEGFVRKTVSEARPVPALQSVLSARKAAKVVGTCPLCGKDVVEKDRSYSCSSNTWAKQDDGSFERTGGCGFTLPKAVAGKKLSESVLKKLFAGEEPLVKGLKKKAGGTFDARLKLREGGGVDILFDDKGKGGKKKAKKG